MIMIAPKLRAGVALALLATTTAACATRDLVTSEVAPVSSPSREDRPPSGRPGKWGADLGAMSQDFEALARERAERASPPGR